MIINSIEVYQKGSVYRLCHPNGAVLADLKFPSVGDAEEEARIVRIVIKHMKGIWHIN